MAPTRSLAFPGSFRRHNHGTNCIIGYARQPNQRPPRRHMRRAPSTPDVGTRRPSSSQPPRPISASFTLPSVGRMSRRNNSQSCSSPVTTHGARRARCNRRGSRLHRAGPRSATTADIRDSPLSRSRTRSNGNSAVADVADLREVPRAWLMKVGPEVASLAAIAGPKRFRSYAIRGFLDAHRFASGSLGETLAIGAGRR